MTKKQQLVFLLKAYINKEYNVKTFCDEFTRIFYQEENDKDIISNEEFDMFKDLAHECDRYTPYAEDLLISKYFVGDEYIDNAIKKAYRLYLSLR